MAGADIVNYCKLCTKVVDNCVQGFPTFLPDNQFPNDIKKHFAEKHLDVKDWKEYVGKMHW